MITIGIDAGSRMIKVVAWEATRRRVLATARLDQGVNQRALVDRAYRNALTDAGLKASRVAGVIATGYGRHNVAIADSAITEITCHARGVRELHPDARTVIDIGGQDSKVIRIDPDGTVRDFAMNDRCAAGSGRFLEVVAQRLGVETGALGALAARSRSPVAIASMCVVFAETEIIGLLAQRARPADIAAGVQVSLCARVAAMAGNRAVAKPVYFTGGVALLNGMPERMGKALGVRVRVADQASFTGALGAALLAAEESAG